MMNAVDTFSTHDDDSPYPGARIDAQDESYVLPIREYLETHGVAVAVNKTPKTQPMYQIVAGDAGFVKQIFSREHKGDSKRMGIILGGGQSEVEFSTKIKLVLADPTPMTDLQVTDTFDFFFTEGKKYLDLRTHRETRTVHEQDRARVSSIIADVYKNAPAPRTRARKRLRAWTLGMLIGIGIFVIPIIWYGLSITVGGLAIASGAKNLREGNFGAVEWDTRVADYWIHQGAFVLGVATVPLSWTGSEDILRGQERLVSFMTDATNAELETKALTALAAKVAAGLLNQVDQTSTGGAAAADISNLRVSLYTLGNTLGLAQAELSMLLSDRTFPFSIRMISTYGSQAVGDLSEIRKSSGDIDKLLSLFLSLAGFKEPRTYLLLLQNSMELRPTGGFIGSVAIASLEDGRLTNLDVQDVYTFDGQLKGHVDPPAPIRDLLSQEHWYLRDSNWDPDFKEAGTRAAWFYQKETDSTVDGVIAISTPFIIDLLGATGPIELSDYKDRITADNFYGKSLYYTQNDFFPGSTQKRDFLGSLTRALMTTITTGTNVNTTKLFRALTTALSGHDLMMMFADPDLESLVEHYGWAGRVPPDVGCAGVTSATCRFDPFLSAEANLGVNKVNYFVTRALERDITLNENGTISESANIMLHNGSGSESKNLPYQAYVRFVLPPDAAVSGVTIDNTPVATRSAVRAQPPPYVETSPLASGQFAIGVAVTIPASSEKKITVSFTQTTPMQFGADGTVLDIFTQKQAGVAGESVHTIVRYPQSWTAGVGGGLPTDAQTFIAKPHQLEYNTTLDSDALTRIRFTK